MTAFKRALAASALLAVLVTPLAACSAEQKQVQEKDAGILTMELPADVSAEGVLLAAVLLSTSDVEGALAQGLVTPAEVNLAQAAIDDGLLDQWRERAEDALK